MLLSPGCSWLGGMASFRQKGSWDVYWSRSRPAKPAPPVSLGTGLPVSGESTLPLGALPLPERATHHHTPLKAHGSLRPGAPPRGLLLAAHHPLAIHAPAFVGRDRGGV